MSLPHPQLLRTARTLTTGTWVLIGAVTTFSAMTGAQFIGAHSRWQWSGWVLAASIDTAFVMALQADATLARHGTSGGHWPTAFRWLTGACSVFVNTADAALTRDPVGVLVHLIAPALLLVLGEAGPAWHRQLLTLEQSAHLHTAPPPPSAQVRTRLRTAPEHPGAHPAPPADPDEARARILQGHRDGLTQRETARWAHRSPSFVRKVWAALDEESGTAARAGGQPPVGDGSTGGGSAE
ncbi:helix-turn-helix domain-containing protein [Kitasatospora viridis]|uniref:DUF2637 domain-containing protein n=1 Tax=Kitasatospora viridis TaxID=281105 RepID=A0A561TW42_9ACTN|nr:helix-turn-helix domain-containing protein [Kitasatospora viridis]TWF91333.1 hypothetical protein FHX73_12445 [Kitasatospora viridis]